MVTILFLASSFQKAYLQVCLTVHINQLLIGQYQQSMYKVLCGFEA